MGIVNDIDPGETFSLSHRLEATIGILERWETQRGCQWSPAEAVREAMEALVAARPKPLDGNWLDENWACRVCGGEIPHGHTNNCDIYKDEQTIRALETAVTDCYKMLVDSGQLEVHVPKSLMVAIEMMKKAQT